VLEEAECKLRDEVASMMKRAAAAEHRADEQADETQAVWQRNRDLRAKLASVQQQLADQASAAEAALPPATPDMQEVRREQHYTKAAPQTESTEPNVPDKEARVAALQEELEAAQGRIASLNDSISRCSEIVTTKQQGSSITALKIISNDPH
jgi:predicted  nucleic acid-binding Zn-ribbon protein